MKTNVMLKETLCFLMMGMSVYAVRNVTVDFLQTSTDLPVQIESSAPQLESPISSSVMPQKRITNFATQPGLRKIGAESRTASFNTMLVRHAKRLCNNGLYRVFSHDGKDFSDFWQTAQEVNLDIFKAYECMRLFGNNLKSCEVVDNTVIEQILTPMPDQLSRYFCKPKDAEEQEENVSIQQDDVEDLLLGRFTEQFDQFQTTPDVFLSRLSNDIVTMVKTQATVIKQEQEEKEFREKLRMSTIRLLDNVLGKSIWYTKNYESIWPSFISVADKLHTLGLKGVINDQDYLDELWSTHVRRFIWYLDFKGQSLPVNFYTQIEEDLNNNIVFFLEAGEQDEGIISKKEMLSRAVAAAKAKSIAYEKGGIITNQIG